MAISSTTVLGKYRILREIARSNDIVYEAIDPAMGRRVALKELQLPPNVTGAQKRERIERFYREARAAGALTHPNIVTIHEVGEEDDRHFIVMEYLVGQSLRDLLQMQGAMPLSQTIDFALQLCDALGYAHGRGVIHRDIKPDNVHVLAGNVVKITDFGIARLSGEPSITSQGQVFGTPSYMSPEQVASGTVDHRTDIFSLGVTLFEMLTGRKPFAGDSVITITYNIMNTQPSMPMGVPPALHGVLQRALAKDPAQRYQSMAAMASDLRAEKWGVDPLEEDRKSQMIFGAELAPSSALAATHISGTLQTGVVPSHISGLPALPLPALPLPTAPLAYVSPTPAAPAGLLTPQGKSFLKLLGVIIGLLALLGIIIWGIRAASASYQNHAKEAQADQLSTTAEQALRRGDYQAAERAFDQAKRDAQPGTDDAKRAASGQAQAAAAQGEQAARANNPADALADYERALNIDRQNAAAYDGRANIEYQQGNVQAALQDWEAAVREDASSAAAADARSNAAWAYSILAQQAQASGNLSQARTYWQKIIDIAPGTPASMQAEQRISSTAGDTAPASGSSL